MTVLCLARAVIETSEEHPCTVMLYGALMGFWVPAPLCSAPLTSPKPLPGETGLCTLQEDEWLTDAQIQGTWGKGPRGSWCMVFPYTYRDILCALTKTKHARLFLVTKTLSFSPSKMAKDATLEGPPSPYTPGSYPKPRTYCKLVCLLVG